MIEIVQDRQSFAELECSWNNLAEPFRSPLLRHEWFFCAWSAFHEEDGLHIVLVKAGSEVRAIAPLVLVRRHLVKRLALIGVSSLYEPSSFLYSDLEALDELVAGVVILGYPILLQRIRKDSPVAKSFNKLIKKRGLVLFRATASSRFVDINCSWEDYYSSLSEKRRYDHRRAEKRAQSAGEIKFDIVCPGPEDVSAYLLRFIRVEAASWKGRTDSALLHRKDLRTFFETYTFSASRQGILYLCFLRINDEDAGAQIGLKYDNRFWILKIGYNENSARCSPGILLTKYSIQHAFENRFESYEFLGSEESWVGVWAKNVHEYVAIGLYPISCHGINGLLLDVVSYGTRKIATYWKGH